MLQLNRDQKTYESARTVALIGGGGGANSFVRSLPLRQRQRHSQNFQWAEGALWNLIIIVEESKLGIVV